MPAVLSANTPSNGYISWTAFGLVYAGVTYNIAAGQSNQPFVWWRFNGGAPLLQHGQLPSDLGDADLVLFGNKNGVPLNIQTSSYIEGGLVVDGSILTDALAANVIVAEKIAAGEIGAREVSGDIITAGSVFVQDGIAIGDPTVSQASVRINRVQGIRMTDDQGNPTLNAPVGGSPSFTGDAELESATFLNGFEARGESVGRTNGTLKMGSSVSPPTVAPTAVELDRIAVAVSGTLTAPATTGLPANVVWAAAPATWWTPVWNAAEARWWSVAAWTSTNGAWVSVMLYKQDATGAVTSSTQLAAAMQRTMFRPAGAFFIGTRFFWAYSTGSNGAWVPDADVAGPYVKLYTVDTSAPATPVANVVYSSSLARDEWNVHGSTFGTDGTDIWFARTAKIAGDHAPTPSGGASFTGLAKNDVYATRHVFSIASGVITLAAYNHAFRASLGTASDLEAVLGSINVSRTVGAAAFDYPAVANKIHAVISLAENGFGYGQLHAAVQVATAAMTAVILTETWYFDTGGLAWNTTDGFFWARASRTSGTMRRHEHHHPGTWEFFNTWYDGNATGATHETTVSPPYRVALLGRHPIRLSTSQRPAASSPATADDVTGARFYARNGAAGTDVTKIQGLPMVGAFSTGEVTGPGGVPIAAQIPATTTLPANVAASPAYSLTVPSQAPLVNSFLISALGTPFRIYSEGVGFEARGDGYSKIGAITSQGTASTATDPFMPTDVANKRYVDRPIFGFITAALLNGWVSFDGGTTFSIPSYTIIGGEVVLKGAMKSGSAGVAAFQLPVGYRPLKTESYLCPANAGWADIRVAATGDVTVQFYSTGASNAIVSLNNIRFIAEQ
jgi:hypothetical protein